MVKSVFRGEMERMEDLRLLRRYAREGCAASFEAVVRRHIGWVYSSSVRQVGDPELAQDVTQAVFVLLARRAGSLGDQTVLTGWLFNTLRFTAREARRKEARRRKHESRAALAPNARHADAIAADTIDDEAWEAMAPLLDDAVTALSESDRQAVLLRFYEGRDFAEIAEVLGVNEGAARKRVSRAVQRLSRYFKKRGIALPLAALAATLVARTSDAAPFGLSESIVSTITGGATLTPLAATLLRRTTRHLLRAKRRLATAVVAAMGLLGVAVTGLLVVYFCESAPDAASLESETPLAWSTRASPIPPIHETITLPASPARGRLIIETAPASPTPPAAPPAPGPLAAAADAVWWVRQWFDPAHAPTPDMQARRAAEVAKNPAADSIVPVSVLPRAAPNAPRPDVVESYAQMGGGGGATVAANATRGGAPVGGELNGATARSAAATPGAGETGGQAAASTIVQTVLASPGSATADAAPGTAIPSLTVIGDRSSTQLTGAYYDVGTRTGVLTWFVRGPSGADIVFNGLSGTGVVVLQYGSDYNTRVSVVTSPDGGNPLLKIAYDQDGATQTVLVDLRHLTDSPELAQLPKEVRDSINVITPLSITENTATQSIALTAIAVPEPTTPLLLAAALLTLTTRRRRPAR